MKVFYSWQADTPREIGKAFLREALDRAVAGLEIDEAERPLIDQDTEGVRGSPIIAETIFEKIRAADLLVVDVTLVGETAREKRLINSNVAIEMGYALGIHGDEVLVKVMNTFYGPPDDLPFDLRHRRWPVRFALPPDATPQQKEKVLGQLAGELQHIMGQYLAATRPPTELFLPTKSTINPAIYWQPSEPLLEIGAPGSRTFQQYQYDAETPLVYVHIWPHEKIASLSQQLLTEYNKVSIEPLCGTPSGWSNHRNRFGHLAYASEAGSNALLSTTQVFKTGEIWGINHLLLRQRIPDRNFIPIPALEAKLRKSLTLYLTTALSHFAYPNKVEVRFGMVNVNGFILALPHDQWSDKVFEDIEVHASVQADDTQSIETALLSIFGAVYEAAGKIRR